MWMMELVWVLIAASWRRPESESTSFVKCEFARPWRDDGDGREVLPKCTVKMQAVCLWREAHGSTLRRFVSSRPLAPATDNAYLLPGAPDSASLRSLLLKMFIELGA